MCLIWRKSNVFKLNKYLSVRFEGEKTIIYIKEKPFIACKYLLMNAPVESINFFESIDQMSENLNAQLEFEITSESIGLQPEEEFRGHCSNLQVWVEHDYDTRLLHRNLAFPLLKKLTDVGDAKARARFSLEVVRRFKSGYPTVQKFLVLEKHLSRLKHTTLEELIEYSDDKDVLEALSDYFNDKKDFSNHLKTLKRLLWINPIHRKAYLALAFIYLRIDKLFEAKLVLKELLNMYPDDDEALLFLANLYWFEEKADKANNLIEKLELTKFSFLSRKKFVELKSYEFSSLVPRPLFEWVKHGHKWIINLP